MSQSENQDRLLDHQYDDIQEYDNPMPRWWVYTFWATIVFSVVYALNVAGIGSGEGRIAQYEADMAAFRARHPQGAPGASEADLAALVRDEQALAVGKATYAASCASCHGQLGEGLIGPNLTDAYWLHGGTLPEILHTVSEGVPAKGMPPWGKLLKPEQLTGVTAYIASLAGTSPPNAKPPQGEPIAAAD